jgi:hypothetical protein
MVIGMNRIVSYINNTFIHRRTYNSKRCNEVVSCELDITRTVHIILHGKSHLLNEAQAKLALKGFERARMQKATLDKAGEVGDYVAMAWPPMDPKEIVISEIVGQDANANRETPLGVWGAVQQKELDRIPLK